jgi:hypothetical protein
MSLSRQTSEIGLGYDLSTEAEIRSKFEKGVFYHGQAELKTRRHNTPKGGESLGEPREKEVLKPRIHTSKPDHKDISSERNNHTTQIKASSMYKKSKKIRTSKT